MPSNRTILIGLTIGVSVLIAPHVFAKSAENEPVLSRPSGNTVDAGEMVSIPAGTFLYGVNKIVIDLPEFTIDKTEVTVEAYGKCVNAGRCTTPGVRKFCNWGDRGKRMKHPVNCVNWKQAESYCMWAEKRLPTEEEWEKAARGIDGRTYPWGEERPSCKLTIMKHDGNGCGKNSTWPVCSKMDGVSPYGLCDMAGNVYEMTASWEGSQRTERGGSWYSSSVHYFPVTLRQNAPPTASSFMGGFRCAKNVK